MGCDLFLAGTASLLCLLFIAWYLRSILIRLGILDRRPASPASTQASSGDRGRRKEQSSGDRGRRRKQSSGARRRRRRQTLQSWWEPFGEPKRYWIPISGRSERVLVRVQPCRGMESLGRLSIKGREFAMNWRRTTHRIGNISTSKQIDTWPGESLKFPCTALAQILDGGDLVPDDMGGHISQSLVFEPTGRGDTLRLRGQDARSGEVHNTVVDISDQLTLTISPGALTGTYEHHHSVDTST